jgi:hypothetical protein
MEFQYFTNYEKILKICTKKMLINCHTFLASEIYIFCELIKKIPQRKKRQRLFFKVFAISPFLSPSPQKSVEKTLEKLVFQMLSVFFERKKSTFVK